MPVNTRILLRRGAAADWSNQVLYSGEIGFESDSGKFKIGDGTTAWSSLPYSAVLPSELNELVDDRVANLLVAGSNISLTYDDSANTLTIATSGLDTEAVQDIIGANVIAGSNITVSYDDTSGNTTIAVTGVSLSGHTHTLSEITDVTASASELNTLDGITASTAELNILDGVTADYSELNVLDGITASTAELNILDGVTADYAEINLLDGATANTVVNSKTVVYGSGGEITANKLNVDNIQLDGSTISGTSGNITIQPYGISDNVTITGGNVVLNSNKVIIGTGATAANITTNGAGNLVLDTNNGTSSGAIVIEQGSNGNISITPNGNGDVQVNADTLRVGDSNVDANITTNGTGNLILSMNGNSVSGNIVLRGANGNIDITPNGAGWVNIGGSTGLTITGNLVVNGTTTTVNSTTTTVDDPIFTLGGDTAPGSDDNKDRGIEFRYYAGSAKVGFFGYDDSTGKFTFIPDATNSSEVFSGTTGEIDAKIDWSNVNSKPDPEITVNLSGDVSGSGSTTLADLANGTINITTTISADSITLGTDTTGNYVASITNGNYITGGNGGSEGAALTLAVDATDTNTASKVVARDASGNFSAGTITATLSGTATNATNIEVDVSSSNINNVVFVNGTDGNLKPSVNNNLRFDAANNELLGDDATTPTTKLKYFVIDGGTP